MAENSTNRPEIVFGSNVAVWKNAQGRTVTIKPRQYQDKNNEWKSATGWNVSDLAHLAHCLTMALDHCLHERAAEGRLPIEKTPEDPTPPDKQPDPTPPDQQPPNTDEHGVPF